MKLTKQQRLEAYTYALLCAYSREWRAWASINDWEYLTGLPQLSPGRYVELGYTGYSAKETISALCRAIEECEKSKA